MENKYTHQQLHLPTAQIELTPFGAGSPRRLRAAFQRCSTEKPESSLGLRIKSIVEDTEDIMYKQIFF